MYHHRKPGRPRPRKHATQPPEGIFQLTLLLPPSTMNGRDCPGPVSSPKQPTSSANRTSWRMSGNNGVAGRCVVPKPLRLLLVEDDEGDAALLLRDLRRGGF